MRNTRIGLRSGISNGKESVVCHIHAADLWKEDGASMRLSGRFIVYLINS